MPGNTFSTSGRRWSRVCVAMAILVPAVPFAVNIPIAAGANAEPTVEVGDVDLVRSAAGTLDAARGAVEVAFGRKGSSVALTWSHATATAVDLRTHGPSGWSEWHEVPVAQAGPVTDDEGDDAAGAVDPVWSGPGTDRVQLRALGGRIEDAVAHLLVVPERAADAAPAAARTVAAVGLSAEAAPAAAPSGRRVLGTADWGSPGWSYANCPTGQDYMDELAIAVIHHTASTSSYTSAQVPQQLRAIHAFHVASRGWCDIAYNFLVDRYGRVWEGRSGGVGAPVRGGHAAGFNTGSVGVALLGDFDSTVPPSGMLAAAAEIAGWKLTSFGHDPASSTIRTSLGSTKYPNGTQVTLGRVTFHGGVSATSCPGDHVLARFASLRAAAASWDALAPFVFGRTGDQPLVGDWDGNGTDAPALRRGNAFYIRNAFGTGPADLTLGYGLPTDVPLVGDWNGDGRDSLGVFRNGRFLLRNSVSTGAAEVQLALGLSSDVPVVGDWDGDGVDEPGVQRGNEMILFDSGGSVLHRFGFGRTGDVPVIGDWNGDGVDTVGVRRGTIVYTHDAHLSGAGGFAHVVPVGLVSVSADLHGRGLEVHLTTDGRTWRVSPVVPA